MLERLVTNGLVHKQEVATAALYSANRNHLAWPAVVVLMGLRSTLIERLSAAVSRLDPAPAKATLFGSVARGDGDVASDVDLLLVQLTEDRDAWRDSMSDIAADVHRWTGNHVQWVTVSKARWDRMVAEDDPLVESVDRDGISLLNGAIV